MWSEELHPIPPVVPFTETPGPVHQLSEGATPVDFLHLFWEPALFQLLADETNRYAVQRQVEKPDRKWYPTTPEEMRAFIGVNIVMGIDQKPHISHYWSTDPYLGNAGIASVFPRERFEALCRYIHLRDTQRQPERGHPEYDPLYKLRPLIDLCHRSFLAGYTPGRDLSIDEAMIKYKGRVFFRQYMPKKPVKWGIKVWMLAEAGTGYVSNFDIYLGKPSGGGREGDLSSRVVLQMSEPFQFTNRHLYFDNFFTSVGVVEELLRRGTYACGTLRANRYPSVFKGGVGRKALKLKEAGEMRQAQKGTMLVTVWLDKRQVAVLSSNCSPGDVVPVQRRSKQPPHSVEVRVPSAIHTYNKRMGGVDLSDQLRAYYPSGRSCKKWWRFVLWFLLDVAICNAFLLYGMTHSTRNRTQLQFRLDLAKQLIGGFCGRKRYPGAKRKFDSIDNALSLPNLPGHFEVRFQGRKRVCVNCSNHDRKTPAGRTPQTLFGCSRCGVNLCRNGCFLEYHTENAHTN